MLAVQNFLAMLMYSELIQYKFVFTPAMNGCSLIVGNSPLGKNYIRIFHNQHPTNKKINDLIRKNTSDGNITDSLNFDDMVPLMPTMPLISCFIVVQVGVSSVNHKYSMY
ncbi:hypothetical protein ARAF_2025 [Arsenophonus endosymbiont of Aleurodicus floccissimus]|uniref:hypothetical protein n=1 Tax=Arsenophonus endosymbiont of Aleurodicus floccissimus TaxID=2152761 RepID=UPI000E6B0284|nr:hypothetical protein [Arsenophonus endosymbiont of Aleurodicus floccissimus]SPP32132.1 hypothetical protein ARAF_2025 [Arsenophonus endosymbiont of Aleurodicus floccissimus]